MMLLEESGLRVPWKVPLPLEKNAPLALLMLTVIHLELERLEVHQAPKHLAEWDIGILIASAWIWDLLAGTDGEMMASHFSVLSMSPLRVAKELTEEI